MFSRFPRIAVTGVLLIYAAAGLTAAEEGQLDASRSLFSVLAAINAAGYDADLDSPANHPLRARIRRELASREIPCLGTTHADHFSGPVPVTRFLTKKEVLKGYEEETGAVIVERFARMNPEHTPAVLVAGHAPFVWGKDATDAVRNSLILERVAQIAIGTFQLRPDAKAIPSYIQDKHYQRKHGPKAYYGQKQP